MSESRDELPQSWDDARPEIGRRMDDFRRLLDERWAHSSEHRERTDLGIAEMNKKLDRVLEQLEDGTELHQSIGQRLNAAESRIGDVETENKVARGERIALLGLAQQSSATLAQTQGDVSEIKHLQAVGWAAFIIIMLVVLAKVW